MILLAIPAAALILVVLWDVFEVIILPRRLTRTLRFSRLLYRALWHVWKTAVDRISGGEQRENLFGIFGPLALVMLLATWAFTLVIAFGVLQFALGSDLQSSSGDANWRTDIYLSGTTFFTLGLGDVAPGSFSARFVTVIEAGLGFGFLALVIGYLPVFYQSFSRREVNISLLDARAGSPPTAGALLQRFAHDEAALMQLLADWERWSADLLESHLSYPVLAYFRSQHERQSWVAALTCILDVSAVVMVRTTGALAISAEMTFAMARHAAVDLSQIFDRDPQPPESDRLTPDAMRALWAACPSSGDSVQQIREIVGLRATYEPFVHAMATYLRMPAPPFVAEEGAIADWETSPTGHSIAGVADPIDPRGAR
jgi:hypothetical protein